MDKDIKKSVEKFKKKQGVNGALEILKHYFDQRDYNQLFYFFMSINNELKVNDKILDKMNGYVNFLNEDESLAKKYHLKIQVFEDYYDRQKDAIFKSNKLQMTDTWNLSSVDFSDFQSGEDKSIEEERSKAAHVTSSSEKLDEESNVTKKRGIEQLFSNKQKNLDIKHYHHTMETYVNEWKIDRRFDGIDKQAVEKIKSELFSIIALEFKYLDSSIREIIIPHLIRMEGTISDIFSEKAVFDIMTKFKPIESKERITLYHRLLHLTMIDKNDEYIKLVYPKFGVGIKWIANTKNINFKSNREPKAIILMLFNLLRNQIIHDDKNLFTLSFKDTEYGAMRREFNVSIEDVNAFFNIDACRSVMDFYSIKNHGAFGMLICLLYLAMPEHKFLTIASKIEHEIHVFRRKNQLGTRSSLYKAIGLRQDWLFNILKASRT